MEPFHPDERLDAPAFHRNHRIIIEELRPILDSEEGDVLEIGSGTGQHIAAFARAFPHLTWWPTDADTKRIESIESARPGDTLPEGATENVETKKSLWNSVL